MDWVRKLIAEKTRETLSLRLFGLTRIPLLFYVGVSVAEISPERMVIRIPLKRRTKNHLGSMYFGALCVGADCAPGAFAMYSDQTATCTHLHGLQRLPGRVSQARRG